ncbi:hypothetical protein J2X76_001618 [Neorhizobium sp. 2083]|uniref:hypothetical protein n=1 Tax=Neorhizobium sp. 2083 TaxID=2817762 RepID=UPI002857C4B1|nr:hypothetical protein [Neorhizobium sp. 2083]MDR6816445.1 hypothetical protein [Neorhizobium sp. 2083]
MIGKFNLEHLTEMYFNVYSDIGSIIEGYLIPDGFSSRPYVAVRSGGDDFGPFECDVFLESPYAHGHHATGIVGFQLNETKISGLASRDDIEIADAESGFVFYRRFSPDRHISKRIFRLETQMAPHSELDSSVKNYFQFFAHGVDRYGSETVRQMLEIVQQQSTYVSGRVMLQNVWKYLTEDTIKIVSFRDPFYELAIRLVSVGSFYRQRATFLSKRDEILLAPAMAYFADMNFVDERELKRKIKNAPKDVLQLFESPFTKQISAFSPTDRVSRDAISTCLDLLSQFEIFCSDENDDSITNDLSEHLGIPEDSIVFSPPRPAFLAIANMLRGMSALDHVLEADLILFYFIAKAKEKAAGNCLSISTEH